MYLRVAHREFAPKLRVVQAQALAQSPPTLATRNRAGGHDARAEQKADDYARDEELRDWLAEAESTMDTDRRRELYSSALRKIADEAYSLPLFTYGRTYAFSSDLDYPLTPDEMAHFYMARWK